MRYGTLFYGFQKVSVLLVRPAIEAMVSLSPPVKPIKSKNLFFVRKKIKRSIIDVIILTFDQARTTDKAVQYETGLWNACG